MVTLQIGKEEKVPLILRLAILVRQRSRLRRCDPIFFLIIIADFEFDATTTFKSILTLFRISAQSAFAADLL